MAPTLGSGQIKIYANLPLASALDLSNSQDPLVVHVIKALSNGVGANQANQTWHDRRTLAQSATDSLDLVGAALSDAFGNAISMARLKFLLVINNSVASTLQVGGNANAVPLYGAAADYEILRPGGFKVWGGLDATGCVLTGGSGDILDITHGGEDAADLTYDIVILGANT